MLAYLKGTLASVRDGIVVVEVGGIGYECMTSLTTIGKLPPVGQAVKLYVKMNVREDDVSLAGFYSSEEKEMFLKLTSISGIGPKAAMSILSGMELSQLALAIVTENVKGLAKIKGVGKKTAERIVLELREKIAAEECDGETEVEVPISAVGLDKTAIDAISALRTLGLTQQEAHKSVMQAKPYSTTLEQLIANALKNI